jgi:hypothetical protein
LYFVITQNTQDKQVLEYIQKELNMGKVIIQGKTTSRFIIQDFIGLYLIAQLFNGQIRTPNKLKRYNIFVEKLNLKIDKLVYVKSLKKFGLNKEDFFFTKIRKQEQLKEITLNDNWFAGFSDAEGSFHVSLQRKSGYKILFNLGQKGIDSKELVLNKILLLFGVGKVRKHYYENN